MSSSESCLCFYSCVSEFLYKLCYVVITANKVHATNETRVIFEFIELKSKKYLPIGDTDI